VKWAIAASCGVSDPYRNECAEACGGEICYEDVRHEPKNKSGIRSYAISISGFDSIEFIGERFIVADECIFYKKSAKKELVLERLR
ncbi:MAG: hypothetical protein QME12_02385, partial [Nanoarchaeota archaeon]|nr:hypothetical protein [Nanoarchaeota archaeon]